MRRKNKNAGITLIALVITIIVLLILAGITLNAILGEGGLLKQAEEAKRTQETADLEERINLCITSAYADDKTDNSGINKLSTAKLNKALKDGFGEGKYNIEESENGWIITVEGKSYEINQNGTLGEYIPPKLLQPGEVAVGNQKYNDGTTTVTIPNGFKVSEKTSEQKVEAGLVVIDGKQNEWVWVPVDDIREWVIEAPNTAIPGTNVTATTNRYSQLYDFTSTGKAKRTIAALGSSSSTSYRELDIVTGSANGVGSDYDAVNYNTVLSRYTSDEYCTSLDMLAKQFSKDYNDMIESISTYHGFYIGRYELTGTIANPTEIAGVPLTNQTWYNLYNACSKFSTNEVASTMIWGMQWDMTMEFVSTKGDKKPVDSTNLSSSWGNYENVDVYNSERTSIIKASGTSAKLDTGITTYTMANNIYDLAGNCYGWTQEAYYTSNRVLRGGNYYNSNAAYCYAGSRNGNDPMHSYDDYSSRATLYLKAE